MPPAVLCLWDKLNDFHLFSNDFPTQGGKSKDLWEHFHFSAMFSKGDSSRDFRFAYLENKVFQKWGLLLQERICSDGSKFFPLRDEPHFHGRQQ